MTGTTAMASSVPPERGPLIQGPPTALQLAHRWDAPQGGMGHLPSASPRRLPAVPGQALLCCPVRNPLKFPALVAWWKP